MPFPENLADLCLVVNTAPGSVCVTFPGGGTVCASFGFEFGDPSEIVKSLLGNINAALMPFTPIFDFIELAKLVLDCVQAIPDALGPPPDPSGIIACIPGLVDQVNKLLKLIPSVTVPGMIKDIINVIVLGLVGLRQQLLALIEQQKRILAAATLAAATNNFQLQVVVDCETGNLDAQFANMNIGLEPLNRLIGIINILAQLVKLPCVPTIADVELSETALEPIDVAIEVLQGIAAALPTLELPELTVVGPDGKCA